jgi:hypothetical protein
MTRLRWDEPVPTEEEIETAEPYIMTRCVVGDAMNHRLVYMASWIQNDDRRSVTLWNERPNVFAVICTSTRYGATSTWGSEERCLRLAGQWAGWRGIKMEG